MNPQTAPSSNSNSHATTTPNAPVLIPASILRRADALATTFPWLCQISTGINPLGMFEGDFSEHLPEAFSQALQDENPGELEELSRTIHQMYALINELKDLHRQHQQHNHLLHSGLTS